ncbi:MAG: hypothetical protein JW852_06725 [Spirochaetales bacterium]|nr:hypothetical protein [Spirochaetales bacterium]
MTIQTDAYTVAANKEDSTVTLAGTLRLQGREQYQPIFDLLLEAASWREGKLTMNMRDLIFLNSSGISAISLFIIEMRKIGKPVAIVGSNEVTWQSKSLKNFQRLYEQVEITIL